MFEYSILVSCLVFFLKKENQFPKHQQSKLAFCILPENIFTVVAVLFCYFVVLPTVDDDDDSDLYMCMQVCWRKTQRWQQSGLFKKIVCFVSTQSWKKMKKHQIHVICVKAENWICASSTWCVDGDMTTYYAITIYTSAIVSATLGVLGVNLLTWHFLQLNYLWSVITMAAQPVINTSHCAKSGVSIPKAV